MTRSRQLPAAPAAGLQGRLRADIGSQGTARDPRRSQSGRLVSQLKPGNALSAEDVEEQIRSFFARDLA
jgi:hypothetical protein